MKKENSLIEEAYLKAKETIRKCATHDGLYASGGRKGYHGVWARDSMITLIGATSGKDNKEFKRLFKDSILTLRKHQSKLGQIPNAILKLEAKKPQVDFKSIDSSLWYVIGQYIYKKRYGEEIFNGSEYSVQKAITWIKYRDFGENSTIQQLSTTDWQDAFPDKYGTVIGTQALYYKVLMLSKDKQSKKLKKEVNVVSDDELWNGKYYWAYRWKNHNKYKEIGEWFDSFGNLMAIIFDLADRKKSKLILDYIEKKKINRPYPVRSIFPPIEKDSKYWKDYYLDARASPNHYLNGGIWPYLGGFYVLALIKIKDFKKAEKELKLLAESNLRSHIFPEWVDPNTKATYGLYQAWSAGTFLWAYNSLKSKKVLM